uniref:rod shape-determining protein MreD n=1 Tax=Parerythrobacter lutipelagi TaxID=1964208 RepID=UPI0010F502E4|nr:rod shape-determining protein MreD [Parerythrobacter lutipelagi]
MERVDRNSRRDAYGSRINRTPSTTLVFLVPIISTMLASLVPVFFISGALPYIPPLGFMVLMSWCFVRPGIFPVWIGFPLGLFDDLFSGQPFGSAILLWSVAMIAIEIIEARFPWRNFLQDWLTLTGFLAVYIFATAILSGTDLDWPVLLALLPQILISIILLPVLARMVARLDRLRLTRFRTVR